MSPITSDCETRRLTGVIVQLVYSNTDALSLRVSQLPVNRSIKEGGRTVAD